MGQDGNKCKYTSDVLNGACDAPNPFQILHLLNHAHAEFHQTPSFFGEHHCKTEWSLGTRITVLYTGLNISLATNKDCLGFDNHLPPLP